ncbi:lipid-A-disaccharide synthase [Bergeriella denitrificans]|uniref:Lipid-A-disaccharide synthase n=1 Tax=Bergeriella denitrificans TaxID=494 RepID=A0A378ULR5_BERDE|nr:lipid-A-disaccharide synthase [Bergeriella denitrificans]STZ77441.1 lipid-A-disaccharide synthase [Bergeriella denitrificans]
MTQPLTIAICVGEASGDLLGAHLIRAIKARRPDAVFTGIGGERMKAEGFNSLYDQEKLAVRGFTEVVRRLPEILKIRKGIIRDLTQLRPDVFIGIDAPDFNLGVAEKLKKAGIPTIHYVSPSVWAWRMERVHTIVHQVNRVLCLFPMEPQLYIDAGGKAEFVGHPMAQTMPLNDDRAAARAKLGIDPPDALFAILPGSQIREVDNMAPVFFQTALLLLKQYPQAQFILPTATEATRARISAILARPEFAGLPVTLVHKQADTVCTAADVVMVTSGTATLEVALCKRPMVISYKISALTYAYVKRKVKVQHVGLPNILLGKSAVPELLQHDATPEKLAAAVSHWYEHPEAVAALKQDFRELHLLLKKDTAALAAQAVLEEAKAV